MDTNSDRVLSGRIVPNEENYSRERERERTMGVISVRWTGL